ncbi:hypothetical protein [Amycolatopsis rhizosphaerae]|uniref:hypothetical protein n=1 Tax=Amycolatopsis rhizosphaerae TaxID=2053003 RepID=UPI001FE77ECE|nr:hypothetical protein [Amycolatopsis rhizosphaerae]
MVAAPPLDPPTGAVTRPQPAKSARWRSRLPAVAAVLGGLALIGARAAQYGNWLVDDAAITFAYARNLADGLGPVAQPGVPPVEGFSNPTWTALLAIGRLLGLFDRGTLFGIPDYVLFPKALALLCCAGILIAAHSAASLVSRRPWLVTLCTGALLAAVPSFVVWCFSGLENSLFALLVTSLAVVAFRAAILGHLLTPKVAITVGLLAALAALTRPDGAIYAAAYPLTALIQLRRTTLASTVRSVLVSCAAFAALFGAYLTWRYVEFGRLVANTAVAKSQQVPDLKQFTRVGELVLYAGTLAVLLLVLVVGLVMARSSWWRQGIPALLVPLSLALIAYAVLNPDWMGEYRFATPVWAMAALIGPLATAEAFRGSGVRGRFVLAVAMAAALVPSGAAFADAGSRFRDQPTLPMCFVADRFGRVFNTYADLLDVKQGSILEPDLGGTSLTSRLPILDLAGLVDAKIADYYHDHDMAALRDRVFEDVKPTFLHFRLYWGGTTGIATDPRLLRDYYPLYTYPAPAELGGDWVRKDAVHSEEQLAAARAYAAAVVPETERKLWVWPRRSCGDTLRPGQTTLDQH